MSSEKPISARVLAVASYVSVALLGIMVIATLFPGLADVLMDTRGAPTDRPLPRILNSLTLFAFLTVWLSALWNALLRRAWPFAIPRWVVLTLLLVGNVFAGVIYYFVGVRREWRRTASSQSATSNSS